MSRSIFLTKPDREGWHKRNATLPPSLIVAARYGFSYNTSPVDDQMIFHRADV